MPLGVIQVDFGKQQSVFEKMAPFVDKLVDIYNEKKMQDWNNEVMLAMLKDIDRESPKADVDKLFNMSTPPESYFDKEGFTNFAGNAVQMLEMEKADIKNAMKSPQAMLMPEIPEESMPEFIPNKNEWKQLYDFVQTIPDGEVNWDNTLGLFKERLESGRKMGDMATVLMNNIVNQAQGGQTPREKLINDIALTNTLQSVLYGDEVDPETEIWQRAKLLPESMRSAYLESEGITLPKTPEATIDYDKLNGFMADNNLGIKTANVNAKGEMTYVLEPLKGEMNIPDMVNMLNELKRSGVDGSFTKDGLTIKPSAPEKQETPKTPTSELQLFLEDPEKYKQFKEVQQTFKEEEKDAKPKTPTITDTAKIEAELDEARDLEDYRDIIEKFKINNNVDMTYYEQSDNVARWARNKRNAALEWLNYAADLLEEGKTTVLMDKKEVDLRELYQNSYNELEHWTDIYNHGTTANLDIPFYSLDEWDKLNKEKGGGYINYLWDINIPKQVPLRR